MNRLSVFQRLWTKLAIMVAVAVLFVSIGVGLFFIRYERSIHEDELKGRGQDIVRGLSHSLSEHLINDDRWELYNNLRDTVRHGDIVEYALITDLNGEVLAHSDPRAFPMGMVLNDPLALNTLDARGALFQPVGELLYDIAYPVLYNRNPDPVGIVRIGITKRHMNEEIHKETMNLMLISIIFSLIGIVGAIVFSKTLSRPLHQLSEAADAISKGEPDKKITSSRKDEIGKLVHAFNEMAGNIKESKKELETLSVTDSITGLYNYRYFYKILAAEFEKCKRYNYPIACIIFDADFFKSVNDIHGHQFGDLVLEGLGTLISSELRSTDTIARYGGDEFLILLPHSGRDSAFSFAEKIREKIERHKFSKDSYSVTTTISIGISISPEEHITGPDEMIKNADTALYMAKSDGGNKTRIWSSSESLHDYNTADKTTDKDDVEELKQDFSNLTINLKRAYMDSTISLIKILDSKDQYSSRHSYNVTIYALKLANKMGLSKGDLSTIRHAAILHDIGKVGVKEDVLKKKGKLSDEEFETIKKHPLIAVDMMEEMRFWDKEISIIRHHHERYDGMGYPDKLAGEKIPLGARILMLADAFDTITSERSYKNPKSIEEAINELKTHSGAQFDPELVELFIEMVRNGEI